MLRLTLAFLLVLLPAAAPAAPCGGTNLMETLAPETRAEITARVDALPYARGNAWRAERGDDIVHIVGTYHFDDPRHDSIVERLGPAIDAAAVVLVEAGREEEAKLQSEMLAKPDRLFVLTGPTLPERLEEEDWQALSGAMQARGVPAFLAAKMQPWYVAMMLGIPLCAVGELEGGARGLDQRVMERAEENGIPVRALEPYDTVFSLFDELPADAQLEMIRMTLAIGDQAEDYSATLTDAYFGEDVRATWELGRFTAYELPGKTADEVDAELALMEDLLMVRRNRSWIPAIEKALAEGPVFAAFGALHLSGEDGVLALLEREGFTLTRLPF
ncbi:hypothetical protein DEA8626_03780 [Defluviimonas aquaemixtae]|uniref:TraB/GumN family protein n=1 Tax=Albidovulum aquaemixtae TaxID=1542388 RepID=A0A2R8BMT7_9RHOB|nr:TraB/GumN family protein [Defluviimonas aquaemixtae]SPH24742.1 hypothetical protein DEA8626_03780 [Defluviimonas aquaemixtae]